MNFRVGDKVIVVKSGSSNPAYSEWVGKLCTVVEVVNDDKSCSGYRVSRRGIGRRFYYDYELELVKRAK